MLQKLRTKLSLKITVLVLTLVGMFLLGFGTASSMSDGWIGQELTALRYGADAPNDVDFKLLWDAWNKVHQNYAGPIDDQQLVYGAVKGMTDGLGDPHTVFFTPTESKQYKENVNGEFAGIGIQLGITDGYISVVAPLDDTPASRAGIKSGDIIAKVDGKDTLNMSIDEAITKMRGTKGTTVKLTLLPKGASEFKEVTLTRETITVKSVKYEVKNSNIGYLRITQFAQDTPSMVQSAITDLKSKNINGLVLDLRDNPGGYLTGAQQISSFFISPGVVVSEQSKDGSKTDLRTTSDPMLPDLPLVVLVNNGSASASEITAGAIQDRERGKLVGEKTYGKGSVQNIFDMAGGSGIKITIAKWLTPKGRQINGVGITPDVVVTLSADDAKAGKDPQLDKALEILK
ncbi:MAG: S41 family peptidase [Patescibacteria group bacterium]|jgi:carboxyl-terminal processing protease